ncbi:MAG TPA: cytochrome c [Candidatus Saccharimonadales bacterium]|nr:cytochrome c [Candidatus Saccharimonadales bacterium]
MENKVTKLGGLTLAAALLAGVCLWSTPAMADVAAGEATFKAKCAGCHGADGKGKDAMKTRDLSSADVQKQSDADLTGIITNGKGKMPPYKTLSADQVKDLVSYVRSLKK